MNIPPALVQLVQINNELNDVRSGVRVSKLLDLFMR